MQDSEIADITPDSITIFDTTGKVQEKTVTSDRLGHFRR